MCLDLAKRSGVASGVVGPTQPRIEAVTLRRAGESVEQQAAALACFLRDRFIIDLPDLIVIESAMNPAASKSADATISQLYCHGALHAMAGVYGVEVRIVAAMTARKHFCGQASAAPRRKQPRTIRQQREDREATNMMVVRRAIALGYLPHGSTDWDMASAAALWDYGAVTFARKAPPRLVMFSDSRVGVRAS
jgi:hypothetical protein